MIFPHVRICVLVDLSFSMILIIVARNQLVDYCNLDHILLFYLQFVVTYILYIDLLKVSLCKDKLLVYIIVEID